MCGITGNGDEISARTRECANAFDHGGKRRVGAFPENEFRSVGNGRLAHENDIKMILIPQGFRVLRDQSVEIYAGGGAQSAENAECFCHGYPSFH